MSSAVCDADNMLEFDKTRGRLVHRFCVKLPVLGVATAHVSGAAGERARLSACFVLIERYTCVPVASMPATRKGTGSGKAEGQNILRYDKNDNITSATTSHTAERIHVCSPEP